MDKMISRFMEQLKEAMEIGKASTLTKPENEINRIYVAGLGGSGIGANFVQSFVYDQCPVPYLVGKGYNIPNYIDENTLFVASSYSGNTEETLESFGKAEGTGAKMMAISGGGKLIARAKEKGYDYIQVPGDWASPRACLGYSVVQQMYMLYKQGFIDGSFEHDMDKAIERLENETNEINERAEKVAHMLNNKIPIIYSEDRYEPVAIRFRQQINENSKMLCWHHAIPEMNHNELVGWRNHRPEWAVVLFRSSDNHPRNATRMDINKEIISEYCDSVIQIQAKGDSLIERSFYLVHFGDWISWHLSQLQGRDAVEVKVIDYLKGELAKQ
jgi:glucose/mannose-6-phosphate isomerase